MFLIIAVVFVAVFAIVVLLTAATGVVTKQRQKLVLERLESVAMAGRRRPEEEGFSLLREEMLRSLPALDRWLLQLDWFPQVRKLLLQADLKWTMTGLLMKCLAAGAATDLLVYWRTLTLPFAMIIGGVAATGPLLYVLYKRSEKFAAFEAKLPEALDLMVRALRAGHGLMAAIEMVAKELPDPIGGEFRKCFEEQNFGLEFREAMLNLAERVPTHDIRLFVTAVLIQKESGGNLAEILEKVAYVMRERFRLRRQVRVHTAQGRLTGWILGTLPVVVGVALYIIDPAHMSKLWQHPLGLKLMYAATAMTLLGGLIIRKIIRIRI